MNLCLIQSNPAKKNKLNTCYKVYKILILNNINRLCLEFLLIFKEDLLIIYKNNIIKLRKI